MSRDFPIPGSPLIPTIWPCPRIAAATDDGRRVLRAAGSCLLPTGQHEGAPGRQLCAAELDQLEASLEKWRGRVAHEDGVGPAALDQPVERAEDRLLPLEVELGSAGALTDENLSGVDGHLDARPRGAIPSRSIDRLLDRHGRMRRLAGRILRRVETEGTDDPGRAPPLDPSAEALDLVEQHLDDTACLQQRLGR